MQEESPRTPMRQQRSQNFDVPTAPTKTPPSPSVRRQSSFGSFIGSPRSGRPAPRASIATFIPPKKNVDRSIWVQINVMILKRFNEFKVKRLLLLSYILVPILINVFIILLYFVFPASSGTSFNGYLEVIQSRYIALNNLRNIFLSVHHHVGVFLTILLVDIHCQHGHHHRAR